VTFTEENFEDWDFRDCWAGSANYDIETDNWYTAHYALVQVVATERARKLAWLAGLGVTTRTDDGRHMRLNNERDHLVLLRGDAATRLKYGWKAVFNENLRFMNGVEEGLYREYQKYRCLRLSIVPSEEDLARQRDFLSQFSEGNEDAPKYRTWAELQAARRIANAAGAAGDDSPMPTPER
jgi:hypothetical protein